MIEFPYKDYQRLYNELMVNHPDDMSKMVIRHDDEIVENALHYFKEATFPLIYPAKSYAVAVIYATVLNDIYGVDKREILDDPDLFLGQDPYFVPYSQDQMTYEEIMRRLDEIPDWLSSGWAPQTISYCLAECTEEGLNRLMKEIEDGAYHPMENNHSQD